MGRNEFTSLMSDSPYNHDCPHHKKYLYLVHSMVHSSSIVQLDRGLPKPRHLQEQCQQVPHQRRRRYLLTDDLLDSPIRHSAMLNEFLEVVLRFRYVTYECRLSPTLPVLEQGNGIHR